MVKLIVEIMGEVAALHDDGRLHGDLKPSNVLVSREGTSLIDEVGLRFGDVSPTVSIGWSPPEQLLRSPLTAAADMFGLGEMLRRVVGAESLGRHMDFPSARGRGGGGVPAPPCTSIREASSCPEQGGRTGIG